MKTTTGVCISRAHGALECVSLTVLTGAFVVDEIDENVGGVACREKSGTGHHKQRQLLHFGSAVVTTLQCSMQLHTTVRMSHICTTLNTGSTGTYECSSHGAAADRQFCSKGCPRLHHRKRCTPWWSTIRGFGCSTKTIPFTIAIIPATRFATRAAGPPHAK
jgi:hypothetical protein